MCSCNGIIHVSKKENKDKTNNAWTVRPKQKYWENPRNKAYFKKPHKLVITGPVYGARHYGRWIDSSVVLVFNFQDSVK